MDRVLKRVGLSKRSIPDTNTKSTPDNEDLSKNRRRRRSKSRRRATHNNQETKKTCGLFNIDWDSVRDCKSCKSRALTKRFCSKKCDNELYRSNSFKFERFVRNDEVSTLGKKISLCEDYSLPLDQLNKKRPNSIAVPSLSDWNVSSPNEGKIEILETYSTPRDSQQQLSLEEGDQKCFTSPDREYSQPYTTDGSSAPSSDEEFFGHQLSRSPAALDLLNSPDSITEAILPLVNVQSPIRTDIKRHPSPYYYSDLYKPRDITSKPTSSKPSETIVSSKSEYQPKRDSFRQVNNDRKNQKSWAGYHKKYRKSSSLDNTNIEKSVREQTSFPLDQSCALHEHPSRLTSPCTCTEDVLGDDMSRQRHVYETAFDCRVSKSDDDLDEIDKVSNHPVLTQFETKRQPPSTECRRKTYASKSVDDHSVSSLSQKLEKMHLPIQETFSSVGLPLRGYTPSPPSTAPLPTKFHGKELVMNSIRSAPNLPSHSKARIKNLHLPVKSLRAVGCSPTNSSSAFDIQHRNSNQFLSSRPDKPDPTHTDTQKDNRVLEIKDRPRKDLLLFKRSKDGKGTIIEFKGRRRRHKYSSTESMTTSSSGGSMESIKSSTSEGNRSTTSTESRNSSSLSSHESDSGAASHLLAAQGTSFHTQTKLHILSPISDKSSQEPVSEMSDNNRNNNSQKCSPEEIVAVIETTKNRSRRLPQNKNLLNLNFRSGDPEIRGSDSGISIQSRECIKSRFNAELSGPSQTDFSELPFDMPKLRRKRIPTLEACTSGSATSIDFGELPFDMPKLRRRLRVQLSTKEVSVSQASSSQSVIDPENQGLNFRPKLTLNLSEIGTKQRPGLGLSLVGMGLNMIKSPTNSLDIIDVNLPLEKQAWFHGSVTRVEAENVLRLLREGSFLVRNSESAKQDFSLSLKSARGFMHMRIQREEKGGIKTFILGQFSKPFTSIPEMIKHFSMNGLPIRGAEHMCLIQPVIAQLL